jgi:Xaa-Pro aminopeptidase
MESQPQIKNSKELARMRHSMEIVGVVFAQVKAQLGKKAWTEQGLAKFITAAGRKAGAQGLSFSVIVAGGANAAEPHHVPTKKKLKAGESIVIDFGFKYKGYVSDFTRTVFLKSAPKKLALAYRQTELAYLNAIALINSKRNIKAAKVHAEAVRTLQEKHLEKYFIHSLGHGSGREIHEPPYLSPKSKDRLADGTVFSIEPGVYFPKLGGIRIEDLFYLKNGKCQKFINVPTNLENNII